jgi:hypothetical protein
MLELNPSVQRCLTRFLLGILLLEPSGFVNMCMKNQQIQLLLIQFINTFAASHLNTQG